MLFVTSPAKRLKKNISLCSAEVFGFHIYCTVRNRVCLSTCVKCAHVVCTNYHVMLCIAQTVPSKDVGLFEMTKCVMEIFITVG